MKSQEEILKEHGKKVERADRWGCFLYLLKIVMIVSVIGFFFSLDNDNWTYFVFLFIITLFLLSRFRHMDEY